MTTVPPLEGRDLTIGYRQGRQIQPTLTALDFRLEPGDLTCLLGSNGSGKTTLLRTLAGIHPPLSGTILLEGKPLQKYNPIEVARRISVVFTQDQDFPRTTGYELVSLGRHPHTGWDGALDDDDHHWIGWAIGMTGAEPLAERYVSDLSDGERQRLLIARALAQRPRVMLLDEPAAYLDSAHRAELTSLIRQLARSNQLAILMVTHDVELALRMADALWLIMPDNRLTTGSPGDLALNGDLDRAFSRSGIAFNANPDGFQLTPVASRFGEVLEDRPHAVVVAVHTSAAHYAAQLLEREGYQTRIVPETIFESESHDPTVLTVIAYSPGRWMLTLPGAESIEAESLAALGKSLPTRQNNLSKN